MINVLYIVALILLIVYFLYCFILKEFIPKKIVKDFYYINILSMRRYDRLMNNKFEYKEFFEYESLSKYIKQSLEIMSVISKDKVNQYKISKFEDCPMDNYFSNLKNELDDFKNKMKIKKDDDISTRIDEEMVDFVAFVLSTTEYIAIAKEIYSTKPFDITIVKSFKKPQNNEKSNLTI